jgi:quercetin dioxygenase-like cupin family protein
MKTTSRIAAAIAIASGLALHAAQAQLATVKRTDLLRSDLSVPGREVLQVRVDFAPGVVAARHSHPGEEVAYVIEGELEYQFDGQAPIRLKAGQALFIPAGAVHTARNVGAGNAAELATYLVDKSRPLVTLAGQP